MAENFFKMQADNVFGWEFDGNKPSDEFILRMAKIGVVVEYVSDADNDYEGALLHLTQMGRQGTLRTLSYHKGDNQYTSKTTVLWTEDGFGGGHLIEKWNYDQKIKWSRVDERE